ncbi:MAG: lysophospholipid acyltransferase family protein, partial [Planctomycetota bacterium]|nr:lysophospholipid acyltransferase family protein [Planctomycetota bacterium]
MARLRNKYIDYLQYLGVRLFDMFAHMFDVQTNYRTARWVGELLWRIDRKHRRIACEHLRLSFPDWHEARIERIARKSMYNMAYLALEVLFTPRLITPNRWRRHIRPKNIAESVRLLIRQETGMILLTGHFGNWEIAGYVMATLGFPTVSVARPLDNPYINDYLMGVRERTGQSILHKKGATSSASDILQQRGALAFIADQDAGRRGLFVDFFGRPASTYRSIALLARQYDTPIAVGYGKRLSDKFEFEVGIKRVIHPSEWAGREDEITWITREFTRELEEIVRSAPEQYLWVHRRWKHRPDGT